MYIDILAFLFIIAVCVVVHEYGHYRTAVACGVQVHEFAFGMGPPLISVRGKRNLWSIRLFPIGGFVRLAGMEEDDGEPVTPGMGFDEKSGWARLAVLFAGPGANIVLAFALTAALLWGHGILDMETARIGVIMEGYPAQSVGLRPGDVVLSVNGQAVHDWATMAGQIRSHGADGPLNLQVRRDGADFSVTARVPVDPSSGVPLLGIQPGVRRYPLFSALKASVSYTVSMSVAMVRGLVAWIGGHSQVDVSGPVGIASMAGSAAKQGLWAFVSFLAVISLNLGIVNLFPFPALDGGRIAFILGEMLLGRKLPTRIEGYIHLAGFVVLIALIVVITWHDVARLLSS